jgi:hypothetical protein
VDGDVIVLSELLNQPRGEVHVEQELHGAAIGMSISAALQAE